MQKQVVITIERDGTVAIDAQNFQGQGCKQATEAIEIALSGKGGERDDRKKPEYYAHNTGSSTLKH